MISTVVTCCIAAIVCEIAAFIIRQHDEGVSAMLLSALARVVSVLAVTIAMLILVTPGVE